MRTSIVKKHFCLIVVLLFLIPTVAAFNVSNDENKIDKLTSESDSIFDLVEVDQDVIDQKPDIEDTATPFPADVLSIEVRNILEKYDYDELKPSTQDFLVEHNQDMLERYKLFTRENPSMPYEPLDITGKIVEIDPETGQQSSIFPDTELVPLGPVLCDPNNYQPNSLLGEVSPSMYRTMSDPSNNYAGYDSNSNSRSARAGPDADVELVMLEWDYVQEGWGEQNEIETLNNEPLPGNQYSFGAFQVGKTTPFTATVRNNDPQVGSIKVWVNFSMTEVYTNMPMDKSPISNHVTLGSTPVEVEYEFTPKFAGVTLIQCAVNYESDTDTANNYFGLWGIPVFIWSADLETGGTNYGWQQMTDGTKKQHVSSDWTGDKGASDAWHTTDNPANDNAPAHSKSNTWFHGQDVPVLADTYGDDMNRNINPDSGRNHTYLQTPYINMGDVVDDERTVRGIDQPNTYYSDYNVMFACLITGEYELESNSPTEINYPETDWAYVYEHEDGNSDNWFGEPIMPSIVLGNYATMEDVLTTPRPIGWHPNGHITTDGVNFYYSMGYPMRVFISDGSGGVDTRSGQAKNWTSPGVRFRADFTGDGEDDNTGITGCYYDDFVIWGIQDYVIPDRVGLTEVTYPTNKVNGDDVPMLHKDSTASFSTTVENFGKAQSFNVKVTITDMLDNEVFTDTKSSGNLPTDEEKEIQWTWVPDAEGDYKLSVVAGDLDKDWTPGDNEMDHYLLHVRSSQEDTDVDVLVVDDDRSMGGGGWNTYLGGRYFINVEERMLQALEDNDIKYRVYTVDPNETGPENTIMNEYELVIWITGLDNEYHAHAFRNNWDRYKTAWDVTLKTDDLEQLSYYLANKENKFWLISPGFLYDYYSSKAPKIVASTASGDFAYKYLHIDKCQANVTTWNNDETEITEPGTPNPLVGYPKSVLDGVSYESYWTTANKKPVNRFTDLGSVVTKDSSDSDTEYLFYQDDQRSNFNALMYKGTDYMTVYFGFNFYLIKDEIDRQDCVYKILTGYGMTGGVTIEPVGDTQKTVQPGSEVSFQFKVTNTGKKQDTMTLSVRTLAPPSDPLKYKDWETRIEIGSVVKNTVTIPGLQDATNIKLYVKAPSLDDMGGIDNYPLAGEIVNFEVKAVSELTDIENETRVSAEVPAIGTITIDCLSPTKVIEVDDEASFLLRLLNETNGADDTTVTLSFTGTGASLAMFYQNDQPTNNKIVTTDLEPNDENEDIELYIISEEHTLAGYHNVTVNLKDDIGDTIYDFVNLSVNVKQFYQVECNTTGDENGDKKFIIDPNDYTKDDIDYIKYTFTINTRNYGNGIDDIALSWDENALSESFIDDWYDDDGEGVQPGIYTKSGLDTENITSIEVGYYDETKNPEYGEEQVYFDVFIPIDAEIGTYIFDFEIESSGIEEVLVGEQENNKVSFEFTIIRPNLQFSKLNNDSDPNFEFWDYAEDLQILKGENEEYYDDYYIEVKHDDFDFLSIEIKVLVDNIGMTSVDLERSDVWLNISWEVEDEYGDYITKTVNLTATSPTSVQDIGVYENLEFTFLWDELNIEASNDYVEVTCMITIDPFDNIYETRDDDNSGTFEILIKHIPKPTKKKGGGGMPGFDSVLMISAIALVLFGLMITSRRRRR